MPALVRRLRLYGHTSIASRLSLAPRSMSRPLPSTRFNAEKWSPASDDESTDNGEMRAECTGVASHQLPNRCLY